MSPIDPEDDVGSIVITQDLLPVGAFGHRKGFRYTATATSDSGGVFPATVSPGMVGELVKVVTQPLAPLQPDPWDIFLLDPDGVSVDVLGGTCTQRPAASSSQVYPVVPGAVSPVLLAGDYNIDVETTQQGPCSFLIHFYVLSLE